MPIDANQWRASIGLLHASRMPRSLVAMKGTKHLRKRPSCSKYRGALFLTAVLSACVVVLQMLWSAIVCVSCVARKLPDVNWWISQFEHIHQALKHTHQAVNRSPSLLDSGRTALQKVLRAARNSNSHIWNIAETMTTVPTFRSLPKGVKALALLLTCLVVVQMLLIMAGDVELNPGPPKKQGAASVELKELVTLPISKWRAMGLQLGLPDHTLDRIQADQCNQPEHTLHCIQSMFSHWLRNSEEPSYTQVAEALAAAGETAAAETLCSKLDITVSSSKTCRSPMNSYITQYAEHLKKRYRKFSVIPKETSLLRINEYDVQVALIEHSEYEQQQTFPRVSENRALGKIDQITAVKKSIKVEEIFGNPPSTDSGDELKILIDGAPGVGKTTLSRRFAKDWANGKLLNEYQLVVLLPLRERRIMKATSLDELFYHDDPKVQEEVVSHIRKTSGRGLMLIFDGFDELSHKQRQEESLFLDIICSEKLSECSVVVTSRPYASHGMQCFSTLSRHVEVLGFKEEQIRECIYKNMKEKSKAQSLIRNLRDRQDIISLCYIPLNCAIVMFVYDRSGSTLPDTLTELYEMFLVNVLKRHVEKYDMQLAEKVRNLAKLPNELLQKCLDGLSKLAYTGIMKDKSVFLLENLESELSKVPVFESHEYNLNPRLLGMMTSFQSVSGYGTRENYQFLHRTIQEFLAARHAANMPITDQVSLFKFPNWYHDEHLKIVRLFLAGISKLNHEAYNKCFPSGFIFVSNGENEGVADMLLQSLHVIHESQNKTLCKALTVKRQVISMRLVRLSPFDCRILAYYLLHSEQEWKCLDLTQCDLTDACLEVFRKMSSRNESNCCVRELILSDCEPFQSSSPQNYITLKGLSTIANTPLFENLQVLKIKPLLVVPNRELEHADGFAKILQLKCINHLSFCDMDRFLNSSFLSLSPVQGIDFTECKLLEFPVQVSSSLRSIYLAFVNVDAKDMECIAVALKSSKVATLELKINHFSNEFASMFPELCSLKMLQNLTLQLGREFGPWPSDELAGLQHLLASSKTLQSLKLTISILTAADINYLTKGLEINTTLKSLSLIPNEPFATLLPIFAVLRKKRTLEELRFACPCSFSDISASNEPAMQVLGEAIHNNTLKDLMLFSSNLNDTDIGHIAHGLQNHPSISSLCLRSFAMQYSTAVQLFRVLHSCPNLVLVQLHGVVFTLATVCDSQVTTCMPETQERENASQIGQLVSSLMEKMIIFKLDLFSNVPTFSADQSNPRPVFLLDHYHQIAQPIVRGLAASYSSMQYCGLAMLEFSCDTTIAVFKFKILQPHSNRQSPEPHSSEDEDLEPEDPEPECPVPIVWDSLDRKASFQTITEVMEHRLRDGVEEREKGEVLHQQAFIGIELVVGYSKVKWCHKVEEGECWTGVTNSGFGYTYCAIADSPF